MHSTAKAKFKKSLKDNIAKNDNLRGGEGLPLLAELRVV